MPQECSEYLQKLFGGVYEKLNKEEHITVINITHYMDEAAMADRVIVFNDGKFIMDGTPEEVFSKRDELISLGLDVPQSVALAIKLKKAGIKLEGGTVNAELCAETIRKAISAYQNGIDQNV
jgi:energy-coupling factor transport system ATP-binding protein